MKSFASLIKKAFPLPRLFVLSDVALNFFDGRLSFFEFGRSHGAIRPKTYGTIPFPRLRRDMKEDRAAFADAGNALKTFASSQGYKLVKVVVHEGDVYAFKMRVPTVHVGELRAAIESALEQNVPIPPAEALFEYDIVAIDSVRNETEVAVTVLSEKVISGYISLLQAAGMTPVSFETESRAMSRSLIAEGDTASHAVLAIEEHHSVVFIVEGGITTFSSSIEVGSADLLRAVAKTFNVTEDKAKLFMAGKALQEGVNETTLFEAMVPALSTLSDELGKVLLYFKGESQRDEEGVINKQIADVILAGVDARTPGFIQYISATLKVPTKVGSVWTNVPPFRGGVPNLDERLSLGYASLIGAHFS